MQVMFLFRIAFLNLGHPSVQVVFGNSAAQPAELERWDCRSCHRCPLDFAHMGWWVR
jgi:hypothetical protein